MRPAMLLLLAVSSQAASLTIDPPVIYDCTGTVGKATVRWKDASGPVQVLVGPSQAQFTGVSGTSGSAETGKWVGDGLEFRLVNQKGEVEALTTAHVDCDAHVNANGLKVEMPTREIYIKGPGMIFKGNPNEYLTEIQMLVS